MIDETHSVGLRREISTAHAPLSVIRAFRKTGCAIVTVERAARAPHRHRVSLRRYALLRAWTHHRAPRLWHTSGFWDRSSFVLFLWSAL